MLSKKLILSLALWAGCPIIAAGSNPIADTVATAVQEEIQPIPQPRIQSRWENFVYATEQNAGRILFGIPLTLATTAAGVALLKGCTRDEVGVAFAGTAVLSALLSFFTYFGITESLD
jgi:hypothetical protein